MRALVAADHVLRTVCAWPTPGPPCPGNRGRWGRLRARVGFFVPLSRCDLWAEIVEKKNVALAIAVGAMCIAIGLIVSAAAHG
jgi:hypothetical protein